MYFLKLCTPYERILLFEKLNSDFGFIFTFGNWIGIWWRLVGQPLLQLRSLRVPWILINIQDLL